VGLALGTAPGHLALTATVAASGMASLDATVVNVALPHIGADLDASISSLQWVLTGYLLTLASLILLGGALGDRYGIEGDAASAQWPEGGANLGCEEVGLLPGGEVPAPVGLVVVHQGGVAVLDPAARCLEDLAGDSTEGDRKRDGRGNLPGAEVGCSLALPVRAGGRDAGAGQPVERSGRPPIDLCQIR